MNEILAGIRQRSYLYPGLLIAVNRQRLADSFEIEPSRYETFSRNVLVVVHFDGVRPDQGRKTVQDEVLELAKAAGNAAVQYLARQRGLLRPAGESPTPQQRETERTHQDWLLNVQMHARQSPLHIPPVMYASTPLTEQDVIGIFNQLAALTLFPGLQVFATSQTQTYDCLVKFACASDAEGLRYSAGNSAPLGLAPFIIGDHARYETRYMTLEFKNNLDGLVSDMEDPDKRKSYAHIDICVCWSVIAESFAGYELSEIGEHNLDQRSVPGATHILRRDGEAHAIQVVMLSSIVKLVESGRLSLARRSTATRSR
jgi:hypothetical protein